MRSSVATPAPAPAAVVEAPASAPVRRMAFAKPGQVDLLVLPDMRVVTIKAWAGHGFASGTFSVRSGEILTIGVARAEGNAAADANTGTSFVRIGTDVLIAAARPARIDRESVRTISDVDASECAADFEPAELRARGRDGYVVICW